MISRKMNKQILEGALVRHKNYLSGSYKGYYITIDCKLHVYIVYIHATFDTISDQTQFQTFLRGHERKMQYLSRAEEIDHAIKLRIVKPNQRKIIPSVLTDIIEPLIEQLLKNEYDAGCIGCGNYDGKMDCYEICGYHYYLCEDCIRENQPELSIISQRFKDRYRYPVRKMKS